MLILRNKGFHEFVFTVLPRSLFNTLMDLSYSAFVSKLFTSKDSVILRSLILRPLFYVNPALIRGIFKGFVSRAKKFCSEKYLDDELNFLVDMLGENGHNRNHLYSIIRENKHQAPKYENTDSTIIKPHGC